jgi:hypothetical protein
MLSATDPLDDQRQARPPRHHTDDRRPLGVAEDLSAMLLACNPREIIDGLTGPRDGSEATININRRHNN